MELYFQLANFIIYVVVSKGCISCTNAQIEMVSTPNHEKYPILQVSNKTLFVREIPYFRILLEKLPRIDNTDNIAFASQHIVGRACFTEIEMTPKNLSNTLFSGQTSRYLKSSFPNYRLTINKSNSSRFPIEQKNPVNVDTQEFPFQANLMYLIANEEFSSFCGGSLIHPRWILTAAHCLEENNEPYPARLVYVSLGSKFTSGNGGQIIQAEKLFLNKLYFDNDDGYDIGLVKMKSEAVLGPLVRPVKLHTNSRESLIGEVVYLTGYGSINDNYQPAEEMRKATLTISHPKKCFLDARISYSELCCISSLSGGKICKGDSGGPLTIMRDDTYYMQVGIASRLSLLPICSMTINNSVYTKVSSYIGWISKAVGIDFRTYVPP